MRKWSAGRIEEWTVRAYALLLHVYPEEFRIVFGVSMTQVFKDMVRAARTQSPLAGFLVLCVRTVLDLLISSVKAHGERRESMFKALVTTGILYVCIMVLALGYGAIRFGEFYARPAFSGFHATEPVDEDQLIAAYEQALTGEFGRYKAFAFGAALALALSMGVATALFGLWRKSLWKGASLFVCGSALTIPAVSLLPPIWFPLDRYPVGFMWLLGCSPFAVGAWLLVTLVGRYGPWRSPATSA